MNASLRCAIVFTLVPLLAAAKPRSTAPDRITLTAPKLGFKLVLPAGAREVPGAASDTMPFVYAVGAGPEAVTIAVQVMSGRIARDFTQADAELARAKLPPNMSLASGEWQGLQLMVMRLETKKEQGVIVDYGAQIPLAGRAIIIHVAGLTDLDEKLKKTLADLLLSLTGKAEN